MKRKNNLIKIAVLSSLFVLGASLINYQSAVPSEVEASNYSVNSIPTTINLNDTSEANIRNYYSSLNGLSENERKGTNLLKNLKPILKNNQKYFSYGSSATKAVWQAYEIVDRDWNKSPASSISGYNANTNTITGYVYGTSNSDVGTNPYIHALYVNRNVNNQTQAWGNHEQNQWGINQEHVWAKSCGFENNSPAAGARGDLMHLWAGNGRVNGDTHSNYYYGYVDKTKSYNDAGDYASTLSGNLRGYSKSLGGSVTVFEPQDSDKGDIARAIFYMAARYNYLSGSDSDGIDAGNPNLEIVNNVTSWQNSGYQSTTTTTGKMGVLQDLLEWNRLDPPDQWEIHRNNLLYNNFTNNRNPFIDFPSWADAIWGVSEDGNYNSTPTKSASPTNDPINTFVINTFAISESELALEVGDTAEISSSNANGNITWSVEDDSVVSLNKATSTNDEAVTITALSAGSTTITATNGGNNATCTVTVTEPINYGTEQNPLTVDEALDVISITGTNETAEPLYVKGIITSHTAYNTTYKNYDYGWLQNDDGSVSQAFELYRFKLDSGIEGDYSAANSMVGKEVIAYGYGKIYNTTYELTTSSNTPKNPLVLSIADQAEPTIEDYLNNASPCFELLASENEDLETDTDSITFSQLGLNDASNLTSYNFDNDATVSFSQANGSNAPKYYNNGSNARLYKSNTMTIVSSSSAITRVEISYSNGYSSGLTANVGTLSDGVWTGSATSITFTNSNSDSTQVRLTALSVTTSSSELSITNVAMRFGASIPVSDWDAIADKWEISDYGVMLFKQLQSPENYSNTPVQDVYRNGDKLSVIHKGSGEAPTPEDDKYTFTAQVNFKNPSSYNIVICAAPFIVVDDTYYFLSEMQYSVNSLAVYYQTHGGSNLTDGALEILAGE